MRSLLTALGVTVTDTTLGVLTVAATVAGGALVISTVALMAALGTAGAVLGGLFYGIPGLAKSMRRRRTKEVVEAMDAAGGLGGKIALAVFNGSAWLFKQSRAAGRAGRAWWKNTMGKGGRAKRQRMLAAIGPKLVAATVWVLKAAKSITAVGGAVGGAVLSGVTAIVDGVMGWRARRQQRASADALRQQDEQVASGIRRSVEQLANDRQFYAAVQYSGQKSKARKWRNALASGAGTVAMAGGIAFALGSNPVGWALTVAGGLIGAGYMGYRAWKKRKKKAAGTLGKNRAKHANALYDLVRRGHQPTIRYLKTLHVLRDGREGLFTLAEFLDPRKQKTVKLKLRDVLRST